MSSEARYKAEQKIEEIFALTDENYLYQEIDGPIEEAAKVFQFDETESMTHRTVMRITGDLVCHIYEHCPCFRLILQKPHGRSEALAILEEGYQSVHTKGYYGALLDAFDPLQNGIDLVLTQIVEFIIFRTRNRYIRWIYCSRLDSLDWPTKCLIVEIVLERWGSFMPPSFRSCSPAQFAEYIPNLINLLRSSDNIISEILGADMDWISDES